MLHPVGASSGGMEPDDLLCSRNAPGFVCLVGWSFGSVWFFWMNFRSDQPDRRDIPDEPALVGRAQWKINQPPSLRENERAWKGGRGTARPSFLLAEAARSECASSMRAVKDSLAAPLRVKWGKLIGRASEGEWRDSRYGLCTRRAPTMKRWSLDARSEGQP